VNQLGIHDYVADSDANIIRGLLAILAGGLQRQDCEVRLLEYDILTRLPSKLNLRAAYHASATQWAAGYGGTGTSTRKSPSTDHLEG
jgi:hypothetical protein